MSILRPLVLSGPSGVGKSTLVQNLLTKFPGQYKLSVSHTTRAARPGERDGVAYHFVNREAFSELVEKGGFVEHTESYGNLYGTSLKAIEAACSQRGTRGIIDVDSVGVKNIKLLCAKLNPLYVFVAPPAMSALIARLKHRNTESDEAMARRLRAARAEVEYAATGAYDAVIRNDDVHRACSLLVDVVQERAKGDDASHLQALLAEG